MLAPATILRGAVAAAIQAPSSHNTQPWRFRRRGAALELWLDPERRLDVIDPLGRQATISCGCALYNARLAVRNAGYLGHVTLTPDLDRPDLLAVLELGLPRSATEEDHALMSAVPRRHTNRRPFLDRPVAQDQFELLARAARPERTRMLRLDPAQKERMASLVARADRRRFADPAFRAQLGEWLVPLGSFRKDGIPFPEKEYGSSRPFLVGRRLRAPELGEEFAAIEHERVIGAPLVAVFATEGDDAIDWLDCGQALEAVLLRATSIGLSAAFVDQLLEFEDLHREVGRLCGVAEPQMVIRLGYAPPLERAAPRREVDDVLEEHD